MQPDAPTTCYRHPDRVAGVGCQRCDRPICPQCMVQASVGFQCPECTHQRPQQVISSRTVFARGGSSDVVVGKVLIAVNVIAFLVMSAVGGSAGQATGAVYERGVIYGPLVAQGEWWRILTGAFLHASLIHLGMNMFLLWLLSKELEPAIGHLRFGLLYVASLLGGSLGVLILSPDSATLGASGAIFGLMGALVVLQLRAKQNPWSSGLGGLIVLNLIITFTIPGISIGGHIGGLVAGALAGLLITPLRWPQENAAVKDGFIALFAIGLAILAIFAAGALSTPLPVFS